MKCRRAPLLLPAVAFAAGIFASRIAVWSLTEAAAILGVFAVVTGVARSVRSTAAPLANFLVWCAAGLSVATWHGERPVPRLDAEEGETVILEGCVAEPPESRPPQMRFALELEPGARVQVTATAREGERLPHVRYGDRIEVQARVRSPRNFHNPGAFDYVGYLRRHDIHSLASARGAESVRVLSGPCGTAVKRRAMALREWLAARTLAAHGNEPLVPALTIGDDSGLQRAATSDFRRTGTYHGLVVSGLHITVVAGATLFLLRLSGMPLAAALSIAGTLAWSYAAVTNWQTPVVRSAAGFTLFLVAMWFFRRGRLANLAAFVALVFLALDPAQLFDASFQLTFLSVFAIALIASPSIEGTYGPYRDGLKGIANPKRDRRLPPVVAQFRIELRLLAETVSLWCPVRLQRAAQAIAMGLRLLFSVADMLVVSAAVQFALLIPSVLYFHQVPATSLIANVLVVPLLTAAVPVALVAAVAGSPALGSVSTGLLDLASGLARWCADMEPLGRVPDMPSWLVLAGGCAAAALCVRRTRLPGLAAAVAVTVVAVTFPFQPGVVPGELEVTMLDVGQGEALFLAFPDGRTMLLDAGGIPSFDRRIQPKLDIGEDVVSPYLWRRGLKRLDIVAVSHFHDDHAGGLPAVIRNFRPREVWLGAAPDCAMLRKVESAARDVGAQVGREVAGRTWNFGSAEMSALWPAAGYVAGASPSNDDSLVLALRFGRHRFLLTGDAGRGSEWHWTDLPEIDVLKVAHHGSNGSSGDEFLDRARPLFALVSAGHGNVYGLPSPAVLERLRVRGATVYQTTHDGLITVRSDGRRLSVERPGSGGEFLPIASPDF